MSTSGYYLSKINSRLQKHAISDSYRTMMGFIVYKPMLANRYACIHGYMNRDAWAYTYMSCVGGIAGPFLCKRQLVLY